MDTTEQERYYNLGKEYWWLAGKYQVVYNQISELYKGFTGKLNVLDIGCGPGNMLDYLRGWGNVMGTDLYSSALSYCKSRGYNGLFMSQGEQLPVKNGKFDLVIALDVIEHIDNDVKALEELYRIMKNGGRLCLTVPAFMFLWGGHDEMYGHKRRYTVKEISSKVKKAGFIVERATYFEAFFVFPLFAFRVVKKIFQERSDDFVEVPSWLNKGLKKLLLIEGNLLKWVNMPFGATIICIAVKEK